MLFLEELGAGFAFVGRQYHLEIGKEDYWLVILSSEIEMLSCNRIKDGGVSAFWKC